MMYWFGGGLWGYALMLVSMIMLWGLLGFAIVALYRYLRQPTTYVTSPPVAETPETVLAQRFARGEIDEAEYRHALDVLHGSVHS